MPLVSVAFDGATRPVAGRVCASKAMETGRRVDATKSPEGPERSGGPAEAG